MSVAGQSIQFNEFVDNAWSKLFGQEENVGDRKLTFSWKNNPYEGYRDESSNEVSSSASSEFSSSGGSSSMSSRGASGSYL